MISRDVAFLINSFQTSKGMFMVFEGTQIFWTNNDGKKFVLWCIDYNINTDVIWKNGALFRDFFGFNIRQLQHNKQRWHSCSQTEFLQTICYNKHYCIVIEKNTMDPIIIEHIETGRNTIIKRKYPFFGYKFILKNDLLFLVSASENRNQVFDLNLGVWREYDFQLCDHNQGEMSYYNGFMYKIIREKNGKLGLKSYELV